jgi:hypothetical protein
MASIKRVAPEERADTFVSIRMPKAEKLDVEETARGGGQSISTLGLIALRHWRDTQDDAGAGLLTALITNVITDIGPMAAAFGAPAPSAETAREWLQSPFAYDQAVQAINLLLEAFRPPGEALPPHLQGERWLTAFPASNEGQPVEIDFNAPVRDLGQGAARVALAAVADPNRVAPGKLRRLAALIRQRFPDVAERIRTNLERRRQKEPS